MDFAQGGFDLGFSSFDVAFGETPKTFLLINEENRILIDDNGATRFVILHDSIIAFCAAAKGEAIETEVDCG